jgi:hypothetical protein
MKEFNDRCFPTDSRTDARDGDNDSK